MTGSLNSSLKNNGSLDEKAITELAQGILSDLEIRETSFTARSNYFCAEYELCSKVGSGNRLFVKITNCNDTATAQRIMVDYLFMFQDDISKVTKKPFEKLG